MFEEKSWFDNFPLTGRGILFFIALFVVCFLVGCGGGGDDEPVAHKVENNPPVGQPKPDCATTYPKPNWCPA